MAEISDADAAALAAEFERRFAEQAHEPLKVLPPRPVLTPETARAFLLERATVIAPGETLVIRASDSWTPQQVYEVQRVLAEVVADRGLGFEVLLVPGEEFAVAGRAPGPVTVETRFEDDLASAVDKALPRVLARMYGQKLPRGGRLRIE